MSVVRPPLAVFLVRPKRVGWVESSRPATNGKGLAGKNDSVFA